MTMFDFMMNALYGLAGVACIAIAIIIVVGVLASLYNASVRAAREQRRRSKEREDLYGKSKH